MRELDRLGVDSINLLEFCFPWRNAAEFAARGYRVRVPPFRVLYDYWYAGGLPVAGSELACLDLVEFARAEGLRMGVHYCSLENKHTGQIYQQNTQKPAPAPLALSARDYFLRSAKVFGSDVPRTRRALRSAGVDRCEPNRDFDYLEFPLAAIQALAGLDVEIGLSANVMEQRGGEDLRARGGGRSHQPADFRNDRRRLKGATNAISPGYTRAGYHCCDRHHLVWRRARQPRSPASSGHGLREFRDNLGGTDAPAERAERSRNGHGLTVSHPPRGGLAGANMSARWAGRTAKPANAARDARCRCCSTSKSCASGCSRPARLSWPPPC